MARNYVLYADDDPDDRDMMLDIFRHHPDVQLQSFESGALLLHALRGLDPRELLFILVDGSMPVMTGLETIAAIRKMESYATVALAIYSSGLAPSFKLAAESLQAQVLVKPDTFEQIRALVSELIETNRNKPA